MKQGRIIIVSGPSGVGKGTVLRNVMSGDPTLRFSVSATTRTVRPGEVNGVHYYFMDRPRFEEMIACGKLLEYASYAGNYYGTPAEPVDAALAQGISVVLEIEVQGAMQVMRARPDAISVFVLPPSFEELERRLIGRGDTAPESIEKRLAAAHEECRMAKHYQYMICNDTVAQAAARLRAIITAEACKTQYQSNPFEEEP